MDKNYIKGMIATIQEQSRKARVKPDYALMENLRQRVVTDMTDTLRDMCLSGEIKCHITLNSVSFSIETEGDKK